MQVKNPEQLENEELQEKHINVFNTVESKNIADNAKNYEWQIEELDHLISASFKSAGEKSLNENDGAIYMTLSGGVDSSLALAVLRKTLGSSTKIVTVTMSGSESHPDLYFGKLVANTYGSEHFEYIPDKEEIMVGLAEFQQQHPEADLSDDVTKGNFDVFMLYRYLSQKLNAKTVIAHDGIDELMGGYWPHRQKQSDHKKTEQFKYFWSVLMNDHLQPLTTSASIFGIDVLFPYLENNLVDYVSGIPLDDRTDFNISKKPIRSLAEMYAVPQSILERPKRGQVGMMDLS